SALRGFQSEADRRAAAAAAATPAGTITAPDAVAGAETPTAQAQPEPARATGAEEPEGAITAPEEERVLRAEERAADALDPPPNGTSQSDDSPRSEEKAEKAQ
ncbi:MAG: hypothetical protein K6T92_09640, partial [Candidatus Rokubacteria bacterium]|nr:hypothetical protein [Candidatus Rokubacteria bacterium]